MNIKDRLIVEEFRKERPNFVALGDLVSQMLTDLMKKSGITILGIEHRVKTESSLAGKLARYGDRFHAMDELTDLLGARIICFFADDVDKIGKLVEQCFTIDWEHSSDKRALIKADSFGYLSLHYICSLPDDAGYPKEFCNKRFEIQIRTNLQHTWSAINHDLGYKSEFGVPRVVARQFARIAGLLEIADDEFVRARDGMTEYTNEIRKKITDNCADDVLIDLISLREFVERNYKMRDFTNELAEICGADLDKISPESYIEQLNWLGKKTLGDLQKMLEENHDLALAMAKQTLANTELDILSSNVGLRFLCRAELVNKGYTLEQATEFLMASVGNAARAERQAKHLLNTWGSSSKSE